MIWDFYDDYIVLIFFYKLPSGSCCSYACGCSRWCSCGGCWCKYITIAKKWSCLNQNWTSIFGRKVYTCLKNFNKNMCHRKLRKSDISRNHLPFEDFLKLPKNLHRLHASQEIPLQFGEKCFILCSTFDLLWIMWIIKNFRKKNQVCLTGIWYHYWKFLSWSNFWALDIQI